MATKGLLLGTRFDNLPEETQDKSLLFGPFNMVTPDLNRAPIGITDTFSLAIWIKNENGSPSGSDGIMLIRTSLNIANIIDIKADAGSNTDINVGMTNSGGGTTQNRVWNNVIQGNTDTWVHYVITFGGSTGTGPNSLKLYTQGVDRGAPDTINVDSGNQTYIDSNRAIGIGQGSFWIGPVYSASVYNTILTQSSIATLYNSGNARDFDPTKDFGSYTNSSNLLHYFRLGQGSNQAEFGTDEVAIPSDLSLLVQGGSAPDQSDLTTDIPL